MKYFKIILIISLICGLSISCKPRKDLTMKDYLIVEEEILSSDLTPESEESILKKRGFTIEQYRDFETKIENDPVLKEKAGEMRLQMHRQQDKIE